MFDVPEIMTLQANDKRLSEIPKHIHTELRYNGYSTESNIIAEISQEEYFAMWDNIDTRGLFRNGEYTGSGTDSYLNSRDVSRIRELSEAQKEVRHIEQMIKFEKRQLREANKKKDKKEQERIMRAIDEAAFISLKMQSENEAIEAKIRNEINNNREFQRLMAFFDKH